MSKIILFVILAIFYIVDGVKKGMSIGGILAYIPMGISIFVAVFGGKRSTMFVASIVSGILTFVFTHIITFAFMIGSLLIIHTIFFGE